VPRPLGRRQAISQDQRPRPSQNATSADVEHQRGVWQVVADWRVGSTQHSDRTHIETTAFIRSEFDAPQNQQYLFIIEQSTNTIDAFTINLTTGAIVKAPGNPFADLNGPDAAAANPAGTFLFVANNAGSVSVFSIAASGALTEIAGSPFASSTGTEPAGIPVSNDGTFLFVASSIDVDRSSNSGEMDIFRISANLTIQ
jgi:6-phosphogluconolactonase (cycloisomerase 2 family)